MATKAIKIKTNVQFIALAAIILIYLITVFFFARWCVAHSIARQAPSKEVAEYTVSLAPDDPQTHYALAVLNEKSFQTENLKKALIEYEIATALSPYDFRLWLELGITRGQSGDEKGSEKALRKALELAPNYAEIHWALGNKLARQNKIDEGFKKIGFAAQRNPKFIKPAISTAWLIFDGDLTQIKRYVGDFPELNAELAMYLAEQNEFDEALEFWNKVSKEKMKGDLRDFGERLYAKMLAANKYQNAFQIIKQIDEDNTKSFAVESIYNGGFETDVNPTNAGIFEWQLASGINPQIGFDDGQKHDGKRSLVIVFGTENDKSFRTISQMVIVKANETYEFEAFYKSDLKTPATLKWDIYDASSEQLLVESEPIAKNTDWTSLKTQFKTNEQTEAVFVRLVREPCKTSVCPILGKVWFDDLSLTPISSATK